MWPAPAPRCWFHPAVEVRPSLIDGYGSFARVPVAAGTPASRLGGRLVTGAKLDELFAAAQHSRAYIDCLTVGDGTHLVLPPDTP